MGCLLIVIHGKQVGLIQERCSVMATNGASRLAIPNWGCGLDAVAFAWCSMAYQAKAAGIRHQARNCVEHTPGRRQARNDSHLEGR